MQTKTYAGISEAFSKPETAKIVLIPVPYDGTSTFQKGADKAFIALKTWLQYKSHSGTHKASTIESPLENR